MIFKGWNQSCRLESGVDISHGTLKETLSQAFAFERVAIQEMFEKGLLSWDLARQLKNNLTIQELKLEDI